MKCTSSGLRFYISFGVILSMLGLATGCGNKPKATANLVPVRIGWQVAWATQGQLAQVLQHTNALQKFGLDGSLKPFLYGAPLSEAALGGNLDVAFIGDQPAINLVSRSKDWKIVGRLMDFRVAVVVPPSSAVKTTKDLKGKTMGIPFGSSAHRVALRMIADAGLKPVQDVRLLNIDIQEQNAVVGAGGGKHWPQVDAFASWDPSIALYQSKQSARVLQGGTALGVIVMSNKFITAHPDAAAGFLAAFKSAYLYYALHGNQADGWFSDAAKSKISPQILDQVAAIEPNMKAKSLNDVDISLMGKRLSALQEAADFAYQDKLIQSSININSSINSSVIAAADKKLSTTIQPVVSVKE